MAARRSYRGFTEVLDDFLRSVYQDCTCPGQYLLRRVLRYIPSRPAIFDEYDYEEAIKHVRTVLWDREDLAWELLRFASFGGEKNEGSKTGALDYGDLNAEYVSLIQSARAANVNLGLLQGLTEKWVAKFDPQSGKMRNYNTGDPVPDGFKKVADHVDITLNHRWDEKAKEYVVKIGKFPNKAEKDKEIANLSFGEMAINAFPDSDVSCWL